MTRGHHLTDEEVLRALRDAPEKDRDDGGGWHAHTLAERLNVSPDAIYRHLRPLIDSGAVVVVWGLGPVQPRRSYLPADHPDAEGSDA